MDKIGHSKDTHWDKLEFWAIPMLLQDFEKEIRQVFTKAEKDRITESEILVKTCLILYKETCLKKDPD